MNDPAAQHMPPTPSRPSFPPFSSVLKSREVEDPVNLLLHRPLAYGFARAVWRTPLSPNGVTVLAILTGFAAGACWLEGSSAAMVWGGALLWISAILDGADGILARAKRMQSQFGRALDGAADLMVAAATVLPAVYHIWTRHHQILHLLVAVPCIWLTGWHLYLYDYYKESFLRQIRLDRGGESEDAAQVAARVETFAQSPPGRFYAFMMRRMFLPYLRFQESLVRRTNRHDLGRNPTVDKSPENAAIYRQHNRLPMRLWITISLAPHSYLMAIFGMCDRLDLYIWLRLGLMNLVFGAALWTQRRASRRTRLAFGLPPAG